MNRKTEDERFSERLEARGALKAAIARRQQEAGNKGINRKARYVAQELGEEQRTDAHGSTYFCFDFWRTGLHIVASRHMLGNESMMNRTRIFMNESPVFVQDDSRIEGYVPGNWEELLDRFHAEAEAKHEERAAKRAQAEGSRLAAEEAAERAKWGL